MPRPGAKKKEAQKLEAEVDKDLDNLNKASKFEGKLMIFLSDILKELKENTAEMKALRSSINLLKLTEEELIGWFKQAEIERKPE